MVSLEAFESLPSLESHDYIPTWLPFILVLIFLFSIHYRLLSSESSEWNIINVLINIQLLSIIISLPLNSLTEACNLNSFSLCFIATSTNDIYSEISLSLCFTIVSVNLFRSDSNRAVGTYSILQLFLVLCRAAETHRRQFQGSCWHNPQLPPRWNPWKSRLTGITVW